jgi:hypothetical protein
MPLALDYIPCVGRDFSQPVLTLPGSATDRHKEKTFSASLFGFHCQLASLLDFQVMLSSSRKPILFLRRRI